MSDGQGIFGVFFCTIIYIEEGLIMPTITLFATFVHNGLSNWFCNWIQLACLCWTAGTTDFPHTLSSSELKEWTTTLSKLMR